ncbi:MAG: hypothetical protein KatS3mg028_1393 [Bacteroidia bacterium]|nr:MAG: hypothetical protein KatS3mg028_1393 [Bacteroidia bacterium]
MGAENKIRVSNTPRRIPLKVGFFSADKWGHVCPTIRVEEPLRKIGVEVIRGNDWFENNLLLKENIIEEVDLVIIQRDFPSHYNEYRNVIEKSKKIGKPVVYEIDDLFLDIPEFHPNVRLYKPKRYRILEGIMNCDGVICSTPQMKEVLQRFVDNVYVLPNLIIPEIWKFKFPLKSVKNEYPIRISFMGTQSHLPDLEMIQPVLYHLSQKYASTVEFYFWGCKPPGFLETTRNFVYIDVALDDYKSFVNWFLGQKSDIFIAPLVDCNFNRSKSPLKYLEYSALGVPGVYSNLPTYSCVVNGVNGFLANSLDEWEYYLIKLIENPILRYEIGTNALNDVRNNYVLTEERAKGWLSVFQKIMQERKPEPRKNYISEIISLTQYWYEQDEKYLENERKKNVELLRLVESKELIIREKETQIQLIKSSIVWRVVQRLSSTYYKALPKESVFNRALSRIINYFLKRRSIKESLSNKRKRKVYLKIIPNPNSEKMITVLIPLDHKKSFPSIQQIEDWLSKQTISAEIVLWDRSNGTLEWIAQGYKLEKINSWSNIKQLLRTKYVVIGFFDLISMPPTFLETNLIALESEGLHFTVNQLGYTNLFYDKLIKGFFPGNTELPLFRVVFHKEIIENFSVSSGIIFPANFQGVGKLIIQPVNIPDTEANVPFSLNLAGQSFRFEPSTRHIFISTVSKQNDEQDSISKVVNISFLQNNDKKSVVLMVHPFLAMGGAENIALEMMNYLQEDFIFIVATHEFHKTELGTTVDKFRQITPYVYTFPDFVEYSFYFEVMCYLIEKFMVDIIYIANGSIWIYKNLLAISKKYPRIRIVNQVYDHEVGWINWYNRSIAKLINAHVASNKNILNAYEQKGVLPNSIYYIENGVNTDFFNPEVYKVEKIRELKIRIGVPLDKKIITFIGRIHPQKRPLDFVELARRANLKGLEYFFLMVGDGALSEAVDGEIMTKGLLNIHHRTFYSPSRDIFAISDVIVLTSEYEGMPMVVLESLSMGVPVVSTNVGNVREVLLATSGGYAEAEPGQIDKLLEGLQKVVDNPPNKDKLREAVKQKYSLEIMAEEYKKVFLGER